MSHCRPVHRRAAWLCIVLLGLPLCGVAAEDERPKTLTERMQREMLRFRVQVQSVQFRLEEGILGPFSDEAGSDGPATPAQTCCSINLRKMRGAVEEMGVIFGEFVSCHEAAGNMGAVATVRFAQNDLARFSAGVEALAKAPTDAAAQGAAAGLVRAYIALLRATEKIEACTPEGQAASDPAQQSTEQQEKKDKPKKSKKKQAEEGSGG